MARRTRARTPRRTAPLPVRILRAARLGRLIRLRPATVYALAFTGAAAVYLAGVDHPGRTGWTLCGIAAAAWWLRAVLHRRRCR